MGYKSSKNTRNEKYEVDEITFYSKLVFETIQSIDEYFRLLYTTDSISNNSENINHSVRSDEKYFDEILGKVENLIEKIKNIDDWLINDLYKEKYAFSFLNKFKGIYLRFEECESLMGPYECLEKEFEKRIIRIKMDLKYVGIDLFYD